jgi:dTDP-4-dehydrorhamnose 3,5-epimerase
MTMNIIVPVGEVTFVLFDDRKNSTSVNNFFTITLSPSNYYRLTVPPGVWHAFKGNDHNLNLILDVADMEHQSDEIIRANIDDIQFEWESI